MRAWPFAVLLLAGCEAGSVPSGASSAPSAASSGAGGDAASVASSADASSSSDAASSVASTSTTSAASAGGGGGAASSGAGGAGGTGGGGAGGGAPGLAAQDCVPHAMPNQPMCGADGLDLYPFTCAPGDSPNESCVEVDYQNANGWRGWCCEVDCYPRGSYGCVDGAQSLVCHADPGDAVDGCSPSAMVGNVWCCS